MSREYAWEVAPQEPSVKLQTYLRSKLNLSLSHVRKALEQNSCRVNGAIERFGSTLLKRGDRVSFHPSSESLSLVERVLFEDEALLIFNKPSYLTSDEQGIAKLFPEFQLVHRLDRDTTGVILLAKTKEAYEHIVHQFRTGQIAKEYLAIVDGVPEDKSGTCESYLGKIHWFQGQTIYGTVEKEKGMLAKTRWKRESQSKGNAALLRVNPLTGKTHQIRVHLKELGHPLLGDRQYAREFRSSYTPKRYLLHAYKLTLTHPTSGRRLTIKAPLPEDFEEALKALHLGS